MKDRLSALPIIVLLIPAAFLLPAQQQAQVEFFSPQGTVQRVRQVQVRFSESMIPFGDMRADQPFDINCTEQGTGRWADDRNWVFDFDQDLDAGVRCEFRIKEDLRTLAGREISGLRTFRFSTGGPKIIRSTPYEGSRAIDENQIFALELNGSPAESSLREHASFVIEGIANRVGVRIIGSEERDELLKTIYRYRKAPEHLVMLQARQKFPAETRIQLIWGKGIASPSGVASSQDQIFHFVTRKPFAARFSCTRENAEAECMPIAPMRVLFSAPIPWEDAAKTTLTGPDGEKWFPQDTNTEDPDRFVSQITFNGPFPELTRFTVTLASGIKDDSGRELTNADRYPLEVETDEYPPLAKFAANFGVLELKADPPLLPVTLRNVEPNIAARMMDVVEGQENIDPPRKLVLNQNARVRAQLQGKIYQVPANTANEMLFWIKKVSSRRHGDRDKSVFGMVTEKRTTAFSIPKLEGEKAFEVLGIPIKAPGFYVVELESELLGAALLGQTKPMYVPTTVLVTNLSVHLKWGIESSLVWITSLDDAKPVSQAEVQIHDCEGTLHWEGKTDRNGLARIEEVPSMQDLPRCSYASLDSGLLVSARSDSDMSFVHTSWDDGIEPWRFQLPTEYRSQLEIAHTIFDRTLFRSGETVHMKHILRKHVVDGFELVPESDIDAKMQIVHQGSGQNYEQSLKWYPDGSAESTWVIPGEAKLGTYQVRLFRRESSNQNAFTPSDRQSVIYSGNFRVENYRVPLMRAIIRPPAEDLVSPSSIPIDATVNFLAGGAAGHLPVKFRYLLQPRYVPAPAAFNGFTFLNGRVHEGLVRSQDIREQPEEYPIHSQELTLDRLGSLRTTIEGLPKIETPMRVLTELDFKDPNGEVQTASSTVPLWPAEFMIGIKPDGWVLSRQTVKFQVAVTDLSGKPVAEAPVSVNLFKRTTYSHRKRLIGGFYSYEHSREIRKIQPICEGKTDKRGLLFCEEQVEESGNLILEAVTRDKVGREAAAQRSVWIAGEDDWWFAAEDGDRMDVLSEEKRYEPGDKARFQVRMPFRKATALITVEREGVGETYVKELSGKEPVIELPVKGNWAPNVFVSVLAVRGRAGDVKPTATVDLGRPAFRLGVAEIEVGWNAHELNVNVATDRQVYKVREKALAKISVTTADSTPMPAGSEVAIAAVDEGLLELKPNESWNLLTGLMGRRRYAVQTSTIQMNVIGKRHFGLKALPQGGGGGQAQTREFFDTLLLWKGRLKLDRRGEAEIEIPLNDSLTSFRIVAVANAGTDRFGMGSTSIRTTQDLILFSGISPLVRQGDSFLSTFTVRNATERPMQVNVSARITPTTRPLQSQQISLGSGESKEISWKLAAPIGAELLKYEIEAASDGDASDSLSVTQRVIPAVPVRVIQATLTQVDKNYRVGVERPSDALPDRGGIRVVLQPRLVDGLSGVSAYMRAYPYTCLEQVLSKAIALHDTELWGRTMDLLPVFLDGEGLAKYFPSQLQGSEVLTAYIISIADEAGWDIPENSKARMLAGLQGFVEGRITRRSALPTADLTLRKLAAIEALSRAQRAQPELLSSIVIEPNLWPTSSVIDWISILKCMSEVQDRESRLTEAQQILRARLNFQGTTMGFSTERRDYMWWLMVSVDTNAVRLLLSQLDEPEWRPDMPRLVRGALGRQKCGHWDTTIANAWGMLAMERFSEKFENIPVTGETIASIASRIQKVDWGDNAKGTTLSFPWHEGIKNLEVGMNGTGKPWAAIQSMAAIPLTEPLSSGFKIKKTLTPIERKEEGVWSAGDIVRVTLEIESQSDMTWVVVNDPIPAGAAIFGSGLGFDSQMAARGETRKGWVWPVFEERSFEAYRVYYRFVPKRQWSFEYTYRLNNAGEFQLPPTRVEAMYAPEMFGEIPNGTIRVR